MKRIFVFFVFFLIVVVFFIQKQRPALQKNQNLQARKTNITQPSSAVTHSLFIPYWALTPPYILPPTSSKNTPDKYIYFGITTNETDVDTQEEGYLGLTRFQNTIPPSSPTALVLRLTSLPKAEVFIQNPSYQNNVNKHVLQIAKDNNFDEIILDLEVATLPTKETMQNIKSCINRFTSQVKQSGLSSGVLIYGDVFYRARPYDTKTIADQADFVYIMLYDFSKPFGMPGPNFPLSNGAHGYSIKAFVDDFGTTNRTKLVAVFGLYGYDWIVDDKGRPIKKGSAITRAQIHTLVDSYCGTSACNIAQDVTSGESSITYTKDGEKHILWFEDEASIRKKIDYLHTQNISSFAYWAHSYF